MQLVILLSLALQAQPELETCKNDLKACQAKLKKPIKKAVVVKKEESKSCCPTCCTTPVKVEVVIKNEAPKVVVARFTPKVTPKFGIGLRGAVGALSCGPYVFGLVGVRGRFFPAHLGLEIDTQFALGHSIQAMVYPIQGPLAWHLDFGGLIFNRNGAQFNILVGTGVEVELVRHLSLTADWRMTAPRSFNLGQSLLKSQVMVGVLLHTW